MRKDTVVFIAIMLLTVLAAQSLPGYLDIPAGILQEQMMLVLCPILLLFIWWTW
ncbi:MAG: hypothetical protein AAB036_01950 [Elusimicrobiota bacterium]